ncbi:hypothetical protein H5200_15070 [Pseudoalteromonas sp. SG43-7]|uniref:hypothetical protein n=1 Tax=Pseudoalteromonas sp. SG43-7 TaxID=2760966 RepID=UPI001600405E|nr:hypothetical protein [Pseudoalteromonas sp. SG43-7]MBB1423230.1 hypothetical protein [Pseudoalteromonas sp. SG43-7]
MKTSILLILVVLIAACGSTPNKADNQSAKEQEIASSNSYKCDMEAIAGSKLKRKRCTTAEQRKREKERADELLRTSAASATGMKQQ